MNTTLSIFKKILFLLIGKAELRKSETGSFLTADSLTNGSNGQIWADPKAAASSIFRSPVWMQGLMDLGHPLLFSQTISMELVWKWNN